MRAGLLIAIVAITYAAAVGESQIEQLNFIPEKYSYLEKLQNYLSKRCTNYYEIVNKLFSLKTLPSADFNQNYVSQIERAIEEEDEELEELAKTDKGFAEFITSRKISPEQRHFFNLLFMHVCSKNPVFANYKKQIVIPSSVPVPNSIDWRVKGGVTSIRSQEDCGSSWAFAAISAIEGHLFRKTGKLNELSVQQLIDCSVEFGNYGCEGGNVELAFAYATKNQGIANASSYPKNVNSPKGQKCKYIESMKAGEIQGYAKIGYGDEEMMKKVVGTLGPIACGIYASRSFMKHNTSEIYDNDQECYRNNNEINHAVTIVGYGTAINNSNDGRDYWLIKNSWDTKWADNGYIKILRNANNFCEIASECSYPIV